MTSFQHEVVSCAKEIVGDLKYLLCKTKGLDCTKFEILATKIATACKYSSLFIYDYVVGY